MLDDVPQLDEIDDVLDALSSPDSLEVYEDVLPYDDTMLIAAAIRIAVNAAGGGGGGGAPTTADYLTGTASGGLSNEIVVGATPGGELGGTWASPTVDTTHSGSSHASVQSAAEATAAAALSAHTTDTSDAHDASAISADSTTLVGVGTDVQAVLEELDNGIADHLADTADAHAGTAITNTPAGAIAATTVQAAINELDTEKQPIDATLTALAAANWAANSVPVGTGADTLTQTAMGASTILARLAAGNIVAATPAELRTLLALVIGTNVQAWDADLDTYAGITPSALGQTLLAVANAAAGRTALDVPSNAEAVLDTIIDAKGDVLAGTAADTVARVAVGTDGQVLTADAASAAGVKWAAGGSGAPTTATYITQVAESGLSAEQALGSLATGLLKNTTTTGVLSIAAAGTDYQAADAELAAIAGLTSAADRLPYFTGSGTASLATFTSAGRALVDDADASAQLTTLGVSTFIKTLLDDADAATARATLGVTLGFAMIGIP